MILSCLRSILILDVFYGIYLKIYNSSLVENLDPPYLSNYIKYCNKNRCAYILFKIVILFFEGKF